MSDTQRLRISLYLDLAKYPELSYLQEMGSGRSAEALRLMAIGKRHEDHVVSKMSEQLGDLSSPAALREILFNPSSLLNQTPQAPERITAKEQDYKVKVADAVPLPVPQKTIDSSNKELKENDGFSINHDNDDDAGDLAKTFIA